MVDAIMSADIVLINANVLTMNSAHPNAEAVSVREGKIEKVGSEMEIAPYIGASTKVFDLKGKTVIPGFADTHAHVSDFGRLARIDLNGTKSITEIKERIKSDLFQASEGKWILGMGWDQAVLEEKRYPTRGDLDEVSPKNPIVLYHKFECICILNTKALEMARITKETQPPSGGIIVKDMKTGELNGVLKDNATNLVWTVIPEPKEDEIVETTALAFSRFLKAGITSVHWMVNSASEVKVIQRMKNENKVPLRVYLIIHSSIMNDVKDIILNKDFEGGNVKIGGFQVFNDGSLAARTAALLQPYTDEQSTSGKLFKTQAEINELASKIIQTNHQLVIHANGDAGVDAALKAIEVTLGQTPENNTRPRIEHASLLNNELIKRIKNLGVVVSMQPPSIISEFEVWSAYDRIGNERARWLFPLRSLTEAGVYIGAGSDCPMEPINPLIGIQVAVSRKHVTEERITPDQALRLYTINAAYLSSEESIKGSIEPGKLADLTVLSKDPTNVPPDQIQDIQVEMTIVGGKIVNPRAA
jgi:predicted amidohydrolase YtcJ